MSEQNSEKKSELMLKQKTGQNSEPMSEQKTEQNSEEMMEKRCQGYGESTDECIICLKEFGFLEHPLKCGHRVHRKCVVLWGHQKCPICQFQLDKDFSKKQKQKIEKARMKKKN